ncbi:HAD hydrolase-like protein [Rudanella paleaurantiibacter]|uniref:HAD hydrolase-like protein n=1 Tax=Rudanella paleaurantiibacter TaxID=2614655 RepID=A0A7J5TYJ0_9BACT|nr:HAD family hydrolase [Rudanella paleaurantiibacter]KAB7730193.1 HAD hydrolase-like protein [Rudanella paleaurantiibacter]
MKLPSTKPPVQLVIFDMAGTTVADEHEVEACFAQAAADTGLTVSAERILAMQGMGKRQVFDLLWREQLAHPTADTTRYVERSYGRFTEVLEDHYRNNPVHPTDGCLETFAFLHLLKIPIALTTGFYRSVTNIILGQLGWLDDLNERFEGTDESVIQLSITSDEVEEGRPRPFMIQKAMQHFGVTDTQAVINIGDTPSDLLSGQAAGIWYNLGLTNGTHTRQQLEPYPHYYLLNSLTELPEFIRSI